MNPLATPLRLTIFAAGLVLAAPLARAADAPRPWPPDQFLPVTEQRVAALPAGAQPAWRAYLKASAERLKLLGPLDLVDHSLAQPSDGPPIPSTYSQGVKLGAPAAWYASEEARTIADHVANWQTATGGWVKTGDYSRNREPKDDHRDAWSAGTFDNDSTIYELRFLALVSTAAGNTDRAALWRKSFMFGLTYVLAAQYPNGGFPQVYPLVGWYHDAITFNDDAMVHILELLRDIRDRRAEFAFVPETVAAEAGRRVERGIQCILAAQLRDADGHRTVWGQQHDAITLQPCAARNFEPVSECSLESGRLAQFLMTVPDPSPAVVDAIEGAVQWFPRRAFHHVVWNRDDTHGSGLVPKEGAPDLWARFYEIGTGKAVFGDRDRTIHYVFGELSNERRKGYGWYQTAPATVAASYQAWREKRAGGK
ncbi:MAG TPA: pectate lyase [Opitutaceae bacterium]|nr:pectate lyase [Opitutaceae bacterium]